MALTPGLYVPQGQVGTGAAYVHEIKDRSGYLDAIAKASEKQRVNQEKQMAKLKGFDYGKVSDPTMKAHISKIYQDGLTDFAKITALGGDISNVTTSEGIAYAKWQEQIEDEAFTAAQAETKKQEFRNKVDNPEYGVDPEMVYEVMRDYDNAQTPDEKLAATQKFDPTLLRNFPYNDWINEEIDDAEKDKEITELGEDKTKYQEIFKEKLKEIPALLASKEGYPLAKKQWEVRHRKGEEGFGQNSFAEFLDERIENERIMRERKSESPAAKDMNVNVDVKTGADPKKGDVVSVPSVDVVKLNIDVNAAANNGTLFSYESEDNPRVPNIVIKGKGNKPENYGLSSDYAYPDRSDRDAILLPANQLYRLESNHVDATSIQPNDKFATAFANKAFIDENGKPTKGSPSKIFEDQLGNTWLVLTDENSTNKTYVILRVGGLMQTYTNNKGPGQQHPFVGVAAENQHAIEKALSVNFNDFMKEYGPKSNLKK